MATKQYFELGEKFWEVWVDGSDLYTRHGKVGANGQVKIKNLASTADAKTEKTKVIAAKVKEGYVEPNGAATTSTKSTKAAATAAPKAATKAAPKAAKSVKAGKAAEAAPAAVDVPEGTQRLEFVEGNSKKFWQIRRDDKKVTIQFGKIGTDGQKQIKSYGTDWEARSAVNEQLEEKKKKGYELVLTGKVAAASPVHTNAALEKAIIAHPDSDDGFMVYADWLQQQGDIRGELAVIQAQLASDPKNKKLRSAEQKLLWDHRAHFWGPLAPYVTKQQSLPSKDPRTTEVAVAASWRQGFIDVLELSANDSWSDEDAPVVERVEELVRLLPKVTSAKFVRDLTIAKPMVNDEFSFVKAIAELAKVLPSLPMLRRLTLGKFDYEDSELSWSHLGKADVLWPLLENLEYLKIKAGSMSLGKIDLPKLRELRIETGGLDKKSIAAIVTARLPALETLVVWFGQENYGFKSKVTELLPFLDKRTFPRVKHLGVANTIYGDELAEHWPTATILPQLKALDISKSHLTVKGMRKLAEHADAFAHLESLDVSDCLLDREGVKLAKTLCKNVNVKEQNDADEYQNEDGDDDEDMWWRYTAVGE